MASLKPAQLHGERERTIMQHTKYFMCTRNHVLGVSTCPVKIYYNTINFFENIVYPRNAQFL